MKTSSLLTALLALVVTAGIATRDDGARADTPTASDASPALPSPNGDADQMSCAQQNIYLITCSNSGIEWDCAPNCPECAESCTVQFEQCDIYCTGTCSSTIVGHC